MLKVSFQCPYPLVFDIVDYLETYFDTVTCFEDPDSEPHHETDENDFPIASLFQVEIYLKEAQQAHLILPLLEEIGITPLNFTIHTVIDQDWLNAYYESIHPFQVGSFYVHCSHHEQPKDASLIALKIDAATAFGSGEHATTQGCLQALDQLISQNPSLRTVLDLGCGSGILGIAAHLKKPSLSVLLSDIDAAAIEIAQRNLALNAVTQVETCVSNGFESIKHQTFDLIIANILMRPLIQMAPDMYRYASGFIVLSGFITRQQDDLKKAYVSNGFEHLDDLVIDDWFTSVFHKI